MYLYDAEVTSNDLNYATASGGWESFMNLIKALK
jgi:hypothetical protein